MATPTHHHYAADLTTKYSQVAEFNCLSLSEFSSL